MLCKIQSPSRHQLLEMMALESVYSPMAAPAEKMTLAMPRAWDQPGLCDTAEQSGPGDRHDKSCCRSALGREVRSVKLNSNRNNPKPKIY